MPDREKVIKRLGKVSYYFKSLLAVGWQGDADTYREHMESVNMAIELLKDQEFKLVDNIQIRQLDTVGDCPSCGIGISKRYHPMYCGLCGQAVKWYD